MAKKRHHALRAQGLVEFALILPVLLLVLLGTIEFGRAFFIYVNIANAAREGARYGMVNPKDTVGIMNEVTDMLQLVPSNDVALSIGYDGGPGTPQYSSPEHVVAGHRVIVTLSYNVQALTPIMEPFMGSGLPLNTENKRTVQTVKEAAISTPARPAPDTHTPSPTPVNTPTDTPTPRPTETPPATATRTVTPTPTYTPTPTNTPTNTPTPTPIPTIEVDEPVIEGETSVTGLGVAGYGVTLRVIQTGLQRTVTVDGDGQFRFSDLPGLVAGHTIVVQGYGTQDSTIVLAPTPTPTSTPTGSFLSIDVACIPPNASTLRVQGYNWPSAEANNPKAIELRFYWDGAASEFATFSHSENDTTFNVNLPLGSVSTTRPGPHTLNVVGYDGKAIVYPSETDPPLQISVPICPPTPTPTSTPATPPDLQITDLTLLDRAPHGTYETLRLAATIYNGGDTDVATLFWVDLYADPKTGTPLPELASIDYVAVNALAARSSISFTMYVPNGFEKLGEHTLVAMVDTWDQIAESDETNNISPEVTLDVTIGNAEPTPTPQVTPGATGVVFGTTYVGFTPQSGVAVYVYAADGRLLASGRSDQNGEYVFTTIPVGPCTVEGRLRLGDEEYLAIQPAEVFQETGTEVNLSLTTW